MIKIAVFAIVSLLVIVLLRKHHPEYALIAAVASGGIILIFIGLQLATPLFSLLEMLDAYGTPKELKTYILKALGICIITKFAADLSTDFGQSSLAGKVEMAGKIALLLLSLPILKNILEVGLSLL